MLRFSKPIMVLLIVTLMMVLSACGDSNNDENKENANNEANNEEAAVDPEDMPEPDLDDVPDVIAEVNGDEIPKKEFESVYQGRFQQALMQSQMSGEEVDQSQLKTQLADAMIGQQLLIQEADDSGFEVSDDSVDETLKGVIEQNGFESKDELFAALEEQDTDKETFMEELETQAKIDHLVDEEAGDIEPTEEEMKETYEGLKKQQEALGEEKDGEDGEQAKVPEYEEIKSDLKDQLVAQKEQEVYQQLVNKLREDADVTNHLS